MNFVDREEKIIDHKRNTRELNPIVSRHLFGACRLWCLDSYFILLLIKFNILRNKRPRSNANKRNWDIFEHVYILNLAITDRLFLQNTRLG